MYGGLFYFIHGRKTHPFHFKSFVDTTLTGLKIICALHKWLPPLPHIAFGAPDYTKQLSNHRAKNLNIFQQLISSIRS